MKYEIARFALSAVAALLLGRPTPVFAQDDNQGWNKLDSSFTLDTFVVNGCTGEQVHVVGHIDITMKTRVNPDGSTDIREQDHAVGEGDGLTSGTQYRFNELDVSDTSLGPNPDGTPFSFTELRKQRVIGLGNTPNQRATFTLQLVIDANGNLLVDVQDFSLKCN
ncbi:MAG: hypothetical protein JO249_24010 [Acidobacteria bacterium]|nr:hypothetical protein [Acidobacteriota bacterium]